MSRSKSDPDSSRQQATLHASSVLRSVCSLGSLRENFLPAPWPHHGSLLELGFCLNKLCSDVCCWCLLTADCWLPLGDEAQKLEFYQTNNTKSGKLKSLWRFLRESLPRGVWPRGVQNGAALGLLESVPRPKRRSGNITFCLSYLRKTKDPWGQGVKDII